MTISPSSRREALKIALVSLLQALGDDAFDSVYFDPKSAPFTALPSTSWDELEHLGMVVKDHEAGDLQFRLTSSGWLEALAISSESDGSDLDRRLGQLSAFFKSKVDGRTWPASLPLRMAALESGLPEGWIFNATEANLLEARFRRRGVRWHVQHPRRVIVIPIAFGVEPVDPRDALRARLAELESEVEERRQELAQYQCPFCSAGMSGQGPGDADGETTYQSFECGYSAVDGRTTRPCPASPEWPPMDEFEFVLTQDERHDRWTCCAKPLTPRARLLYLLPAGGRTAAEARNWVERSYRAASRSWRHDPTDPL